MEVVPLPPPISGVANPLYPEIRRQMMNLLIGGSFFLPADTRLKQAYIRNCVFGLRVREPSLFGGWKLVTRKVLENNTIGVRTWREQP